MSTAPASDSLLDWAAQTPRAERKAKLLSLLQSGELDDEEAQVALYDWRTFWAREEQIAPAWDWRRWIALAGRGWGKTRTLAEWVIEQAREKANIGPIHIVCRIKDDIEKVIVEGPAGILKCSPPWFYPSWSKGVLTWPNGATALTFTAQEPNQLRGPQCAAAACDELAAWEYLDEAWSNLTFGLRLGPNPQLFAATTPRPLDLLRELVRDPATHVTRGRTRDNEDNLSLKAIEDMERKYAGTRRGRQELDGEILDDMPGALWTRDMLQAAVDRGQPYSGLRRIDPSDARAREELRRQLAMFERIAIGVDPSGSPGDPERGDAIGIVAAGRLKGCSEAVVLEDATCQERPEVWAARVALLYEGWDADIVAAEGNFGGDMVRALLQRAGAGGNMPVKMVTASRGKHVRAEPISRLYEQGRVHHARPLPYLDDELCFFTPNGYMDKSSPNRADALVWALTELMLTPRAEPRILRL